MLGLRDYQKEIYLKARSSLLKNRSACIQLATGGGKTPVMASMCESVLGKDKRAWIIVPRKELLLQSSNHLRKWNVPHSMIMPGMQESRAFKIHVVSKDTLIRRYDKIKNWPDLLIFDEAHLYIDRQHEIIDYLPITSKIIGMTATPERLDGRGLSEVYDNLIEGPSIPELTERGFLTDLRYFSPPIDGIQNLKRRGTDYDDEQLEDLLQRRKIYGEMVGHYEKYGKGKAALIFCRSVKSAYQTAERFRDKGFNFHCIEGKMSDKKRKELVSALTKGEIDGLTNCEIATYGLDIPRVEYGASIRPTLSRSLYFQKIGRILRPFTDQETGYKKEDALFFDHVNLVLEHQEPDFPGVPPHYVPEIKWNFYGTEKRKKKKDQGNIKLCPHLDFMYCSKPNCSTCKHNPDKSIADVRKPMVVIPTELEEKQKPIPLNERPIEERKEIQDEIGSLVIEYKNEMSAGAVGKLLEIAVRLGYRELWVYWILTEENRHTVNIPLLHEIARQKNYKKGWVYFAQQKVKAQMNKRKEYNRVMNE
jgi:superfamily II DNA or RNA helicase